MLLEFIFGNYCCFVIATGLAAGAAGIPAAFPVGAAAQYGSGQQAGGIGGGTSDDGSGGRTL